MIPGSENSRPVFLSALCIQPLGESGFFYKVIGTGRTGYRAVELTAQHPYPARRVNPRPQAEAVSGYPLDSLALVAARANRSSDYAGRIPARCPAEGPRP